jgi:hypothetical protein
MRTDLRKRPAKPSRKRRSPIRREADEDDDREALIGAVEDNKPPATVQGKSEER